MKHKKLVLCALLSSVALAVFVAEAQVPPPVPVPGVKLGLANVVTLFAIHALGPWYALGVVLVRTLLGALVTGNLSALAYSLSGGLAAWAVCALLARALPQKQLWVSSVFGALTHNTTQILVAVLITGTPQLFWYLPVLGITGVITGTFTGLCAQLLLARLRKLRLV